MALPVTAAITEDERCVWKANKAEARYAKCLSRSAARLSNVLDGSTLNEDLRCAAQFERSMGVFERRAILNESGPSCTDRVSAEG